MSGITQIKRDQAYEPFIVRIVSEDTLAAVGTAGYLTAQHANIVALNEGEWQWEVSDMVLVYASDGWGFFQIDPAFASLTPFVFGGSVVGAPVVVGNFAVFQSTSGNLEDLGYLPSDASKTRVVMANAATVSGNIAVFTDTHGTIDDSGTGSILNLKYGATPVAQVDPASCTIVGAAGASNVCNVTIQLKDGSGTNMARIIPFRVYASSAADGLTLASAASTGFAVASGGLSLQNGAAVTTQISAMSSATGGCVLSLTDTGKQTSYLVLVLANGCKISAQLSSGSYGA
jgi:hypothetical protein